MPPPGDDRETGELDTLLSTTSSAPVERGTATSPPTLVGSRYQILSLAGTGSMGSVYRARDTELDEIVALKFLRPDLVHSPEMLERFPLSLDCGDWVKRMQTPPTKVAMLKELMAEANPAVRAAFELREDPWGFTIPIGVMRARKPA